MTKQSKTLQSDLFASDSAEGVPERHGVRAASPTQEFVASRAAGLDRLAEFLPRAGRAYAGSRNFDFGPGRRSNVSLLSPYLRHRLITEQEVVAAVLDTHGYDAAEKFIQEVCWRTYWKGWLEQHPDVWASYLAELASDRDAISEDDAARSALERVEQGRTGIACFDAWAKELVETGYLHNHARMWFASIWIFTLQQPWTLGADFFYRHLIDRDPASNTLSWRWVAGLHTQGKTYLARPDNIEKYTGGRFPWPDDLAKCAMPLYEEKSPRRRALPSADRLPPAESVALLLTHDDLTPETWGIDPSRVRGVLSLDGSAEYLCTSPVCQAFTRAAIDDALDRSRRHFSVPAKALGPHDPAGALLSMMGELGVETLVVMRPPVGPLQAEIVRLAEDLRRAGRRVVQTRRAWDDRLWPHASRGFFGLKAVLPRLVAELADTAAGDQFRAVSI